MNLCKITQNGDLRYLVSQYMLLPALKIDNWGRWFVEVILKEVKK